MREYRVYDEVDMIYEIRKNMHEEYPQTYLLIGTMEGDTVVLKEYYKFFDNEHLLINEAKLENYIKENYIPSNLNGNSLIVRVLEAGKTGKICFLLNTHPTEFQRQLAGNERDESMFSAIHKVWFDTYAKLPIFFGIIGKETISIKAYKENITYPVTYQSQYDIDGNPNYDVEFIYNEQENEGILHFINSKKQVKLPLAKICALKEWKEQREKNELPQLHDTAYKSLIVGYYNQ